MAATGPDCQWLARRRSCRACESRTRQACMHASQIVWRTTGERAQTCLPAHHSSVISRSGPPLYSSAMLAASLNMSTNIGRVSLPVWVFWLEGWYEAISVQPSEML